MPEFLQDILIVDDDPALLELLDIILRSAGYHTRLAVDGQEALVLAKQKRPDLIISDVRMPNMDGFAFIAELRKDPEYRLVPFIFLSSLRSEEDINHGLTCGADYFLPKPLNEKTLLSRIEKVRDLLSKTNHWSRLNYQGLTGSIAAISTLELFQIIELGQKSGTLRIVTDGGSGQITLAAGSMWSARFSWNEEEKAGEEAAFAILSCLEGTFAFDPHPVETVGKQGEKIGTLILRFVVNRDHEGMDHAMRSRQVFPHKVL